MHGKKGTKPDGKRRLSGLTHAVVGSGGLPTYFWSDPWKAPWQIDDHNLEVNAMLEISE